MATPVWTAVKTGTSKDMRDNWAVGWSQRCTLRVWISNASGAPMGQVSGTTLAEDGMRRESRPRIVSPTSCTLFAIDPDIPPAHQRRTLKAEATDVRWRLNGMHPVVQQLALRVVGW